MLNLMKLELKKHNVRTYIMSSSVISIIMLSFLYLFAYVPRFDPNDPDLYIFAGYNNVISLFSVVNMTVFCVLAAVMYTRFIIEEYKKDRAVRLFSYPIKRGKIFFSKVLVISLFTVIVMIISNFFIFSIFGLSETFSPLVNDEITFGLIITMVKMTLIMAVTAASLSIIAMGIGFIKKSVPATILSAILLCSLFCNIVAGTLTSSDSFLFISVSLAALLGVVVTSITANKINLMEV